MAAKEKKSSSAKYKIVITVGDEGAIIVCVDGTNMVKRLFVPSPSDEEFTAFFKLFPDAPVYILVDVVDQAYTQHTMPPVSPFNIKKLVKRKLEKDFSENDLTSAIPLGREKSGRRDWNYLFISVRNVAPFSDWIDAAAELPNKFAGVYLLPVEMMEFLKDLKKIVFIEKGQKESEWQMIVSHNKVGGFRQIVFKNGKLVFTRISQPIGGQTPDVVAGNIEQETLNTIEYIRRLGFDDEKGLDVFVIAAAEVKDMLEENSAIYGKPLFLTPYEIASQLGLKGAATENDRFSDVVVSSYFITHKKHLLKLGTDYTNKIEQLSMVSTTLRGIAALIVCFAIFLAANSFISTFDTRDKIKNTKLIKERSEQKLKELEEFKVQFDKDPGKVKDIASMDGILSRNKMEPLELVAKYASVNNFTTSVKRINISNDRSSVKETNSLTANLDVVFSNKENESIDKLLDKIDSFTNAVKSKLENYEVSFSGLPDENQLTVLGGGEEATNAPQNITLKAEIKTTGKKK